MRADYQKQKLMARARGWCFTVNNPTVGEEFYAAIDCKYIIVGDEVGESGTPHHQGYIYCENALRFSTLQKILPSGAHIERALGSSEHNKTYCSKEAVLLEVGDCPQQGKRSDFVRVREELAAGCRITDIIETSTSFQSIRAAELILKYKEARRDWIPEVYWFHGKTGTGKTREAFEMAPDAWVSNKNLTWWDGYDAHEDIIFDDFRGDFCTYHELLRILDRYPYRVMVKGGSRELLAKRIIITCPYRPEELYMTHEDKGQLLRRITEIRRFGDI